MVAVSRRSAFVIPDGLGVVEAALAEPMAVATHAVRRRPSTNMPLSSHDLATQAWLPGPDDFDLLTCDFVAGGE